MPEEVATIDKMQTDLIKVADHYIDMDYSDRNEEAEPERRTKYNTLLKPRFKEVIQWIAEGYTDYSIAEKIGVHYNTLSGWKKEYIEFGDLYARAQDARNCLTMNSMFKRGNGIKVVLKKQKVLADGTVKDYLEEQYHAPDVNAADLFLRNNDPEYKQAKQAETGQNITVNFQLPEARQKVEQLLTEREKLKAIDITGFEVVEAE